jgi:hypothetical protein
MGRMDGEGRVGPLSYDVSAVDTTSDPDRPVILGLLISVAGLILALVGGWFALGAIENAKIVTQGFPLAILVVALGSAAWTSRRLRRRPRRNALLFVLGISALAAFLANRGLATIKPAMPQVRHAIDSVPVPAGFRQVDEEQHGDRFCHRGCPTVIRHYSAPVSDPDPVSTFVQAMEREGWQPPDGIDPTQATIARRGDITIQLGEKEPHVVEVVAQRDS